MLTFENALPISDKMNHTTAFSPVIRLDDRLTAAADFVRSGVRIADIGSDHAYLPIYLVQIGRCHSAVATDIRKGPLRAAEEHVAKFKLDGWISLFQADGLHGIERFTPDDILLCGMGGELIAEILKRSSYIRCAEIHLIMQPMTMQSYLRKWLAAEGFRIHKEKLAAANGKIYPVLLASYDGIKRTFTEAEYLLGAYLIQNRFSPELKNLFPLLLENRIRTFRKIADGKIRAGKDIYYEKQLLSELLLLEQTE